MAARLRTAALAVLLVPAWLGAAPQPPVPAGTAPPAAPEAPAPPEASAESLEASLAPAARRGSWAEVLSLLVRLQRAYPSRYLDGGWEYLTCRALSGLGRDAEALPRLERLVASRDLLEVPARLLAARMRFARGEAPAGLDLLLPVLQRREGAVARRAVRIALDALELRLHPETLARLAAARPALAQRESRRLSALQAGALEAEGDAGGAAALRRSLLSEARRDDAAAVLLARELEGRTPAEVPDDLLPLLLQTARAQRDLELAERLSREAVQRAGPDPRTPGALGARFDHARLLGSRGRFAEAAEGFREVLAQAPAPAPPGKGPADTAPGTAGFLARVRFNLGLVLEKLGDLDAAARELSRVAGEGRGPSSLATLQLARLEIRRGRLDAAERLLLGKGPASERVEGTLLLLVRRAEAGDGRGAARALQRLESAARARRLPEPWRSELPFWQGRVAEARGDVPAALSAYARVLGRPDLVAASELSRERFLALPERPREAFLSGALRDGEALLRAGKLAGARAALLPAAAAGDPRGREALLSAYRASSPHADVLLVPDLSEDAMAGLCGDAAACRLLRMGLPEDAEPIVRDARNLRSLHGCVIASRLAEMADAGPAALEAAEALAARLPRDFLVELAPPAVRRALSPRPFDALVSAAAADTGVPPDLLYAVMRQESRFDREAVSPAAARGLMQLTLPAASDAARQLNEEPPAYSDLYDPARSIRLGATTLASLLLRFEGDAPSAVSGYNAGAGQTVLWRGEARSAAEALLGSISYVETRTYFRRVLFNRALYRLSGEAPGASAASGRGLR
ncbi:MAG: lytic transglycosylase domain-containing protein [Acidobacteria bacterium]|nr:MAG: lytic transglycosylase domain-containing protein [Acidobacteriota bacterium]